MMFICIFYSHGDIYIILRIFYEVLVVKESFPRQAFKMLGSIKGLTTGVTGYSRHLSIFYV